MAGELDTNECDTELYRHFNSDGELLYVGISLSTPQRLAQHMRGSKWADEIAHIQIERHSTRGKALEAERIAIENEMPLWNVVYSLSQPFGSKRSFSGKEKTSQVRKGFCPDEACSKVDLASSFLENLWPECSRVMGGGRGQQQLNVEFKLKAPNKGLSSQLSIMMDQAVYRIASDFVWRGFRIFEHTSCAPPHQPTEGGFGIISPNDLECRLCQYIEEDEEHNSVNRLAIRSAVQRYKTAIHACPWPLPY